LAAGGSKSIEARRSIPRLVGPIIGICGRITPDDAAEGRAAGMDDYVTKRAWLR
jgi:DNA-binding response OmpR family regulator